MKNKSFASFLAGWMLFFILLWTFIIPMVAIKAKKGEAGVNLKDALQSREMFK